MHHDEMTMNGIITEQEPPTTTLAQILNPRPSLANVTSNNSLSLFNRPDDSALSFVAPRGADIEKAAYDNAIKRLEEEFKGNSKNLAWLKQISSSTDSKKAFEELVQTTCDAETKYSEKRISKKPVMRFLSGLSTRIMHYGKIMDTLSNHNPEYVSLVWGVMKFVMMGVINHGAMVEQFAKALNEIHDHILPIAKVNAHLYQTEPMQKAMANLYSNLLGFLLQAVKWYNTNSAKRALKAFFVPSDLSIKEPIQNIKQCALEITDIANLGQRVEVHRISNMVAAGLNQTQQGFARQDDSLHALLERLSTVDVRSSKIEIMLQCLLDDSVHPPQRVFHEHRAIPAPRWVEVNLPQILETLAPTMSPEDALAKQQSVVRRLSPWRRRSPDDNELYSDLNDWVSPLGPSTLVLQAQPRAQERIRIIISTAVAALKQQSRPVIWYLSDSTTDTTTDAQEILKTLVLQAIELSPEQLLQVEPDTLSPEKLSDHHSEEEWLSLLVLILRRLESCFVVVEAEDMTKKHGGADRLQNLLESLVRRLDEHSTSIKLLLVSYASTPFSTPPDSPQRSTTRSVGRDLPVPPRLRRPGGRAAFEKNIRNSVSGGTG